MPPQPTAKAVVSGYHSATGTLAANQELSKKRAFAVRDALKAAGINTDRIQLEKPQQTEANVSGEDTAARRVEVSDVATDVEIHQHLPGLHALPALEAHALDAL